MTRAPGDASNSPLSADDEAHVGRVMGNSPGSHTRPSDHCIDGQHYLGASARLERVNVFGVTIDPALHGKLAIVWGTLKPNLFSALTAAGPCPPENEHPMAQMRSDWIADEGGFKTSRAKVEAASWLSATRIAPITLHQVISRSDGVVKVRLSNPFATTMTGVAIVHHEGGPGKPMPKYEKRPFELLPGASVELELPELVESSNKGRPYKLSSLDVEAVTGKIKIDASLPLHGD